MFTVTWFDTLESSRQQYYAVEPLVVLKASPMAHNTQSGTIAMQD